MDTQTRICDCWLDVGQCFCNIKESENLLDNYLELE